MKPGWITRARTPLAGTVAALTLMWGVVGRAGTYDTYVAQVKPLLDQQDALLNEISQGPDNIVQGKINGWITTSRTIQTSLHKLPLSDPKLRDVHSHMVARAASVTAGIEVMKRFLSSKKPADKTQFENHFKTAKVHLDNFVKARDHYLRTTGGSRLIELLLLVMVILSTIFVYIDARRIGCRKGLTKGLTDMGPGGWAAATALLWLPAFPLYLASRAKIKRAAQEASQS